ncbi:hypothetical protein D9M72_550660 [compost metagenome]
MIVATSASEARLLRASSSSSLTVVPAARSSSSPAPSSCQTWARDESPSELAACRMMSSWCADSPKAATAPESPRFQATWLGEEVS